jgi:hypothetical protein
MTGVSGFDAATKNVYVQVFDQGTALNIKKMKKPSSGMVYTLGSTGHYYVDNDLNYTYKYFYGTNASEVYDTVGEPVVRPAFSVLQEDEILFNDKWAFTTSTNSGAKSTVQVYPNPFSNALTIENMENTSKVEISNILGQTVYSNKTFESNLTISTQELNGGIYFVRITDANNQVVTKRMVKK